jgi:hypothetical protein
MVQMKGQGATEYLVLLAVVLIIALVSISLLGFFPSMASDAKITQSNTYWRGQATPLGILEGSFNTSGNGTVVLVNNDASGIVSVTNMSFTSSNGQVGYLTGVPLAIAAGDQAIGTVVNVSSGVAGVTYQFNVVIHYTLSNNIPATEYGTQPLVGKYNS